MKKRIFIFIISILVVIPENTEAKEKFNDQVQKVILGSCSKEGGGLAKVAYTTIYDRHGQVIEEIWPDGRRGKSEIRYDVKGRVIEKIHYGIENNILEREQFSYNQKGGWTKRVTSPGDLKIEIHHYNKEGYLFEVQHSIYGESSEELAFYTDSIYKYDEKGNKISLSFYDPKGVEITRWEMQHDKNGNVIKNFFYDAEDSSLLKKNVYEYDSQGNETRYEAYEGDGTLSWASIYEYEYDSKGNWVKKKETDIWNHLDKNYETCRLITYY